MLYVPFGEYPSHFVSGPLTEFGETRDKGMILSWSPGDWLELSVAAYEGRAREVGRSGREIDWGLAIESSGRLGTVGLSYISDLADSDERFLEDEANRYSNRVDAISGYAVAGWGSFEANIEYTRALDQFAELDADRDQPEAWNAELAWFPGGQFEIAVKLEGSDEWDEMPRRQYGISVGRVFGDSIFARAEFLRGDYRSGFAETEDEIEITSVSRAGLVVGIQF